MKHAEFTAKNVTLNVKGYHWCCLHHFNIVHLIICSIGQHEEERALWWNSRWLCWTVYSAAVKWKLRVEIIISLWRLICTSFRQVPFLHPLKAFWTKVWLFFFACFALFFPLTGTNETHGSVMTMGFCLRRKYVVQPLIYVWPCVSICAISCWSKITAPQQKMHLQFLLYQVYAFLS